MRFSMSYNPDAYADCSLGPARLRTVCQRAEKPLRVKAVAGVIICHRKPLILFGCVNPAGSPIAAPFAGLATCVPAVAV
jgi:hypothetical protein